MAALLRASAPETPGEGVPHGVPASYSWAHASTAPTLTAPADTGNMNFWGQVYVDESDHRPPNTRVEVASGKLLVLLEGSSAWQTLQSTNALGGGAWTEDFRSGGGPFDTRVESSGSRSFLTAPGHNAHFWPELPFAPIRAKVRGVIALFAARLIVGSTSLPDDRAESRYLVSAGADWRKADGSCPSDICTSVSVGRFIFAKPEWRLVVMSTLGARELDSLPLPSAESFLLPDGTFAAP